MKALEQLKDVLVEEFQLPDTIPASRDALLQELIWAVSRLLEKEPERFFQIMYRLDIPEAKLKEALNDRISGIDKVAALIFERQLQKFVSRKTPPTYPDDEELKW